MATVSVLEPVAEEAENRKKEAKEHWKAIQQSGPLVSTNSLRIGFHAAALKRQSLFGLLGYENEKEAQEASGTKQATWFNVMRIAEAFPGVEEKLFTGMKLTNAEALMDLPESKRLTEYWMRRAATDSIETFKAVVDAEMEDKTRPSSGREKIVSFDVKMTKTQKKVVEEGLREYAKAVGCEGNDAKAIETLVAEHREGVSLVTVLREACEAIARIKESEKSGLSAAEVLERVDEELDEMVESFTAALHSVQNLESE